MDWIKYLELAKQLSRIGTEEYARSAISRAYYAAYNIAFDYISKKRTLKADGGDHSKVRAIMAKNYMSVEANTLGSLHDLRISADYDKNWNDAISESPNAITYAQIVINKINKKPVLPNF